jgi:hypothetical protein
MYLDNLEYPIRIIGILTHPRKCMLGLSVNENLCRIV